MTPQSAMRSNAWAQPREGYKQAYPRNGCLFVIHVYSDYTFWSNVKRCTITLAPQKKCNDSRFVGRYYIRKTGFSEAD